MTLQKGTTAQRSMPGMTQDPQMGSLSKSLAKPKSGVCKSSSNGRQAKDHTNQKNSSRELGHGIVQDKFPSEVYLQPNQVGKSSQDLISKGRGPVKSQNGFDSTSKVNGKQNAAGDVRSEQIINNTSTCTETYIAGASGKGSAGNESIESNSYPIAKDQSGQEVIQTANSDRREIVQISKELQRQTENLQTPSIVGPGAKDGGSNNNHELRVPPTQNSSDGINVSQKSLGLQQEGDKQFRSPRPKRNISRPVLEI